MTFKIGELYIVYYTYAFDFIWDIEYHIIWLNILYIMRPYGYDTIDGR